MRRIAIDLGPYSLEVEVADDVDLDGRFAARDLDEGDVIYINGWLIDNVEEIDDCEAAYAAAAGSTVPGRCGL
jgi:hypothetical protein